MAVSRTKYTVICNTGHPRGLHKRAAMSGSQRIFLFGLAIALIANRNILAQPSAVGKSGGAEYERWVREREDPAYPHTDNDRNVLFDRLYTVRQRGSVSPIVTLHELKHRVPGRAAKEYERALKARKKGENEKAIAYFEKAI